MQGKLRMTFLLRVLKTCGQFVDRILSTARIVADKSSRPDQII
jgi:hypothetical protein